MCWCYSAYRTALSVKFGLELPWWYLAAFRPEVILAISLCSISACVLKYKHDRCSLQMSNSRGILYASGARLAKHCSS